MSKKKLGTNVRQSDGETGLWDRVKRTVDPLDAKQRALYSQALSDYLESGHATLSAHPHPAHPHKGAMKHHVPRHPQAKTKSTPPPARSHTSSGRQPPLIDLDRKTRTRIARGRTPIDARLDLHGLRQHEAHDVLRSFIWRAHANGHRTVLVITGKGARVRDPHPDAPPWAVGSGILRKAVPSWLAAPDLRAAVLGVEPAHASHGGEGALYVRLRAKKAKP
ncbi:MAG: Smr/MutS family protein [Hyphomicrobiales bacterium]|jgi:DNA-nicking Smr family endonuclease